MNHVQGSRVGRQVYGPLIEPHNAGLLAGRADADQSFIDQRSSYTRNLDRPAQRETLLAKFDDFLQDESGSKPSVGAFIYASNQIVRKVRLEYRCLCPDLLFSTHLILSLKPQERAGGSATDAELIRREETAQKVSTDFLSFLNVSHTPSLRLFLRRPICGHTCLYLY